MHCQQQGMTMSALPTFQSIEWVLAIVSCLRTPHAAPRLAAPKVGRPTWNQLPRCIVLTSTTVITRTTSLAPFLRTSIVTIIDCQ